MGNACCASSRPSDPSDVRKKQLLFAKSNRETKRILLPGTTASYCEAQYAGSDRTLSEDRASTATKSNAFYAAQSDTEESAGEGAPVSLHVLGGQAAGML